MTVTPSPQSVVVPLEDWRHVIGALKNAKTRLPMGTAIGNVSDALSKVEHLQPAPAPSSLAGGEVHDAISLEVRMAMQDEMMASDANGGRVSQRIARANRAADTILAALSPEAPAREGSAVDRVMSVLNHWFDGTARVDRNSEMVAQLAALVTPRHEAPADDGPVFHMNLLSHEDNEAWLESARRVAAKHEAPAEGAGEAMTEREVRQWIDACNHEPARQVLRDYLALRARSSAPEAREGLKPQVRPMEDTLSAFGVMKDHFVGASSRPVTHPAAPSADKLRTALSKIRDGMVASRDCISVDDWIELADEALSTPDALKGDVKP